MLLRQTRKRHAVGCWPGTSNLTPPSPPLLSTPLFHPLIPLTAAHSPQSYGNDAHKPFTMSFYVFFVSSLFFILFFLST